MIKRRCSEDLTRLCGTYSFVLCVNDGLTSAAGFRTVGFSETPVTQPTERDLQLLQ